MSAIPPSSTRRSPSPPRNYGSMNSEQLNSERARQEANLIDAATKLQQIKAEDEKRAFVPYETGFSG